MNAKAKQSLNEVSNEIVELSIRLKELQTKINDIIEDEVDEASDPVIDVIQQQSWDVYGPAVNQVMRFRSSLSRLTGELIED